MEAVTNDFQSRCVYCNEPIIRVESLLDGIWRWRHEIYGLTRGHTALPITDD